jgi:hypothetical protein
VIPEQFEIIEEFTSSLEASLTINQISKKISKSYAFTNKYTHELIEKGILKTITVGSAILCSLNYNNKETIASLVYISIKKKPQKEFDFSSGSIVFSYKNKLYYIGEKKEKSSIRLSEKEFSELIIKADLRKIAVLQNPEQFWIRISKLKK